MELEKNANKLLKELAALKTKFINIGLSVDFNIFNHGDRIKVCLPPILETDEWDRYSIDGVVVFFQKLTENEVAERKRKRLEKELAELSTSPNRGL